MDMLRDALRPMPCKWAACSATLTSWRQLCKHYKRVHLSSSRSHKCHVKENQCGQLHNRHFESHEDLWEHIKVHHLNRRLYQCPFETCNMKLVHFEHDPNDIQNHLDEHHQFGEEIMLAVFQELSTTHPSPLPGGEQLSYKLISQLFTQPCSSPSGILKARERVISNSYEHESHLFGSLLTDDWLEEEDATGVATSKERQIRLTGPLWRQQPSRVVPKLETPPLLLFPCSPRHIISSVGFDSLGFHQKALSAFQKVEEDVNMEDG
ncbi:hypothetical protein OPQ81_007044 [Rhizoctonia solani]|nr:hypothetical protein OPQ81_007044 [Rhizoctonia solani]